MIVIYQMDDIASPEKERDIGSDTKKIWLVVFSIFFRVFFYF